MAPSVFRTAFLLNESKCYRANERAQSDCDAIKVWVNVTRPMLPQWRRACKPTSEEPLSVMSDWPTHSEASVHRKLSLYAAAAPARVWVSVCWGVNVVVLEEVNLPSGAGPGDAQQYFFSFAKL